MATMLFSEFLSGILVDVPGCPDFAIEREVRNAAIQLCRRSLAWRKQMAPITVVANTGAYSLVSPDAQSRVVKIYDVTLSTPSSDPAIAQPDIRILLPKTVQYLDSLNPTWRQSQAQALAASYLSIVPTLFYTQDSPDTILLAGIPVLAGSMTILASLVPTLTATGVDSWVAEQHYEGIIHGAKARLMAIPQKPWTDPALAAWHAGEFDKAIASANVEAAAGFQADAPIRVTSYSK